MQTVKIHNKLFHQYISAAEIQDRIVEISKELTKKFADKNPVCLLPIFCASSTIHVKLNL